jgi:hypothetical protein
MLKVTQMQGVNRYIELIKIYAIFGVLGFWGEIEFHPKNTDKN